jgi:CheY-like chemotaxis protein/anti-sigma regulatory factor (Ser/Thr protein kinase)
MSNAVKYTDSGKISLRCFLGGTKKKLKVRFEVEDTGSGIAPEMLPFIFDEFSQSNIQLDKKRKGAGLGLTICKNLVELMGGEVQVKSEPGKGSLFTVVLPFEKAHEKETVEDESHYLLEENLLKGKKILFADDDEYNLLLAETILQNWQADFHLATDGEEARDLLLKNKYDIGLLDIHMPKMNGLEVVNEIRKHPENPNARLKMLAVTANVLKSDVKTYLDSGFDGYVLKPFKEWELYNKICNMLQISNQRQNKLEPQPSKPRESRDANLFDTQALLSTANGDKGFYHKMIETFIRNSKDISQQISLSLEHEKWGDLGEKAHRAIPSFKYFGLGHTVEKLIQLEDLALRKKAFHEIPFRAKILLGEIDEIIKQAEKAATTD